MKIVLLIVGWVIYFFIHSLLASTHVKNFAKENTGGLYKYYRFTYVVISTVGLFLLMYWNANLGHSNFFNNEGIVRYLSLMFAAFGVIVIKVAFRAYPFSAFVGLTLEDQKFIKTGILGSVRHPIYSGTILVAIGFWLFSPNLPTLVSVLCIIIYIPIGIKLEEKKLINQFGEAYIKYKKEVPALFPKLF